MPFRLFWALLFAVSLSSYTAELTPGRKAALDHISAQSLEGHVSFLASDALAGRDTPSPGLDIAAEYIASQFRRAGLKQAGDDGYFQTAQFIVSEHSRAGAKLTVESGDAELQVESSHLEVIWAERPEFSDVVPVKVDTSSVTPEAIEGKVVVIALRRTNGLGAALRALGKAKPAAALMIQNAAINGGEIHSRLDEAGRQPAFSVLRVSNPDLYKLVNAAKPGAMEAKLSLHIPQRSERMINLRNVAGILPGSDTAMADKYVLLTAHYDHVGVKASGEGDRIYNGANDDASGVASVVEIAQALSAGRSAPRRSILFVAFFGEEKGLLGSSYYARHPLVPLSKTVADLNLEQLGRTDGDNPAGTATLTGYDLSDITAAFKMAGAATGIKIGDPGDASDKYFALSDNQSLAGVGIPSHTLLTEFEFPDYHGVGDEWQKLNYPNLEKVDRTIALTVIMIADNTDPPHWNEANTKTRQYVKAQRELK